MKMMEFKQGRDPYEKLKIGRFRERKVGDLVYVKPNALQLFQIHVEGIFYGNFNQSKTGSDL
jgi:hypothetical protein